MVPHFKDQDLLLNVDEDEDLVCNAHFGMVSIIKCDAGSSQVPVQNLMMSW